MKSQIDSSECAKILGSNSKHTHIKINEPADAFRMINFNRQQHNVQSDVASDSNSGPSLSERFKALNSKSNGQDRAIMPNEQAMPNRPISRAKRTGGSEKKKTPETNSLPETARSTQPTVDKVLDPTVVQTKTSIPPMPAFPAFDDASSDDDVKSIDEIVDNVAAKNSQINNNQNGK